MAVHISLNDKNHDLPDGATVARLLAGFSPQPKGIAVVVNGGIVPKAAYETTKLTDGDQVEVLTFAGGG
ncbi:MAG: sulfur carrier protein ThiS [Lentisphaeria bacterium]|nr:sulfur carrier protein ThiS [Lentisphaeria bacterium]